MTRLLVIETSPDGAVARTLRPSSALTRAEIEAGRKLFAGDWQFELAAGSAASLPPVRGIEIAFAGRSNVGKSSLINVLTGRRALARISHTPGRTQELIFFAGLLVSPGRHARLRLCRRRETKVKAWTSLIHDFSEGARISRASMCWSMAGMASKTPTRRARHFGSAAVNYQLVLTKADQVKPAEHGPLIARIEAAIARHPAAFPECLLTSARTGAGIPALRAAIARLLAERDRAPHT